MAERLERGSACGRQWCRRKSL